MAGHAVTLGRPAVIAASYPVNTLAPLARTTNPLARSAELARNCCCVPPAHRRAAGRQAAKPRDRPPTRRLPKLGVRHGVLCCDPTAAPVRAKASCACLFPCPDFPLPLVPLEAQFGTARHQRLVRRTAALPRPVARQPPPARPIGHHCAAEEYPGGGKVASLGADGMPVRSPRK